MRVSSLSMILAVGALTGLAACSDSGAPATAGAGQLNFSIATRAAGGAAISAAAPDSQIIGNDTLVIDSAQVVLRKIDLERVRDSAGTCASADASAQADQDGDSHEGGSHDGHDDDCEELKAGPLILNLPLTAGTSQGFSVAVDTGTFRGVHFQIHKLTGSAADQALLALHPEFTDISVRVVGSFNGAPFVYTNDLTANQEFRFAAPVTVATAGNVDLTLLVDVTTWFTTGGVLINPTTAGNGGANEGTVTHNIRGSFHTFHDNNHDCHDDDGDGEHHGGQDDNTVALGN